MSATFGVVLGGDPTGTDGGLAAQEHPAAAFDGTNYLVVWSEVTPTGRDVRATRVSASGEILDPAGIAISTAAGDQLDPDVTFGGTGWLVVWQDRRAESGDVYAARVGSDGAVLDPQGIPVTRAAGHQLEPTVGFDGTSYVVAWEDRRIPTSADVYAARVATDGQVLDPAGLPVSLAALNQTSPDLGCGSGACLVAWRDQRGRGPDVWGARIASGAVLDPAGIAISMAGSSQSAPAIASDGATFLVLWTDSRVGLADVFGARVGADGIVADPQGLSIAGAPDVQAAPAVAFEGRYFVATWADHRRLTAWDVYGARIERDGTVLDAAGFELGRDLSSAPGDVTAGPEGRELAVFLESVLDPSGVARDRVRARVVTTRASMTVARVGNGGGTVASSPAGIDCGAACAAWYDAPTSVTLEATPDDDSVFSGWSGDCTGEAACTLSLDASRSATARFTPLFALTVTKDGAGRGGVASAPAGIDCGGTCATRYLEGAAVELTATQDLGSVFDGWTGACSGKGACFVAMDGARQVGATFLPAFALTVKQTGGGVGTVEGDGISCATGATTGCSTWIATGRTATLVAVPDASSIVKGWTGCTSVDGPRCTITMTGAKTVTANIQASTYPLTAVVTSISGYVAGGTVTSSLLECATGGTCVAPVDNGATVTLTATPDGSSLFKSWTGCTSVAGNVCTVTMTAAKKVTATFMPSAYDLTVVTAAIPGYVAGGTVTSEAISCGAGSTCTASVANGATVTLTANPDGASLFKSWSGCTSVAGNVCTVTMTAAKKATATFMPASYDLTVATVATAGYVAGGAITSDAGIACGSAATCTGSVANGATVTLTAAPDGASLFKSWSGCTSVVENVCTVTMSSAKKVTATFMPSTYELTVVTTAITGYVAGGTVTSDAVSCGSGETCTGVVANGATVTLTALPDGASLFKSWSGCTSVVDNVCTVAMTGAKKVTATFMPSTYELTVVTAATTGYVAGGTVSSDAISCGAGATCVAAVANGATVTLTATPDGSSLFKSWSGCTSVAGNVCTVAMSSAKKVTATFMPSTYELTVVTVATTGYVAGGTVESDVLSCGSGATCAAAVANGATVTLTAPPDGSSLFKSWSGCTSVSGNVCTVTMSAAKRVTATFMPIAYDLTVATAAVSGSTASGTVTGDGILCGTGGTACVAPVANGQTVTLIATPDAGSLFKSWSGCTSVSGNVCTVAMIAAKRVTATFQPTSYTLTVRTSGTGRGTVSGGDIACTTGLTSGCSADVATGSIVTLTATPKTSCETFTGWSVGCTGTGACLVAMTGAKTVVATFTAVCVYQQ